MHVSSETTTRSYPRTKWNLPHDVLTLSNASNQMYDCDHVYTSKNANSSIFWDINEKNAPCSVTNVVCVGLSLSLFLCVVERVHLSCFLIVCLVRVPIFSCPRFPK
jgi:hypothetical protein